MALRSRSGILLLILLPMFSACDPKRQGLVPVDGAVTYQGKPLPNALVVFMPERFGFLPASGLTDDAGRYELMTIAPGDGVSTGKHRVTITARSAAPVDGKHPPRVGEPNPSEGQPLIPAKYFMPDTSELRADVPAGGGTIDFNL